MTDKADIHRATFYVHYEDIYDLYNKIEDEVVKQLSLILTEDAIHSYEGTYSALITYILENKELSKMLFGSSSMKSFQQRVVKSLEETYLNIWLYEDKLDRVTTEMKMLTAYNVYGSMAIISKWIEDDFLSSSDEIIVLLKKVNDNFEVLT